MNEQELIDYTIKLAADSPCKKRKVAAIITDHMGNIIAAGVNHHPLEGTPCETKSGETDPNVLHAEEVAIENLIKSKFPEDKYTQMFVTHQPCANCMAHIESVGINKVIIADNFMKFDTDKLRYDLIPPSSLKALAKVLTYGAKKYKPNNWKECKDIDRYIAAMMRHFEAFRSGEVHDEESHMPHLWHALTNIAFIIELTGDDECKNSPSD